MTKISAWHDSEGLHREIKRYAKEKGVSISSVYRKIIKGFLKTNS